MTLTTLTFVKCCATFRGCDGNNPSNNFRIPNVVRGVRSNRASIFHIHIL